MTFPHAVVLNGPLGGHDPRAELLAAATRDRTARALLRERRLGRWSHRLDRIAAGLAGVASGLRARGVHPDAR